MSLLAERPAFDGVIRAVNDGDDLTGVWYGTTFVWPDPWKDIWDDGAWTFWEDVWRNAWTRNPDETGASNG